MTGTVVIPADDPPALGGKSHEPRAGPRFFRAASHSPSGRGTVQRPGARSAGAPASATHQPRRTTSRTTRRTTSRRWPVSDRALALALSVEREQLRPAAQAGGGGTSGTPGAAAR